MQLLFLGGPLDGALWDLEPPLTETVAVVEEVEIDTIQDYEPPVRPYFLHTVLTESGPVSMYSTTSDFHEFADQLYRYEANPKLPGPGPDPAALPPPAESTLEMTVWIPRED